MLMETWSSSTRSAALHSPADRNAQLLLQAFPLRFYSSAWTSWGCILYGSGEVPVASALCGIPCCGRRVLLLTQTSPKPPGKASSASCSCWSSRIFPRGDGVPPPTPSCLDRKQTGGHNKHCSQKEVVGLFDANLCRCFFFPPICSHFHGRRCE